MDEMTAAQKKWVAEVQRALNKPGGEGLGFYTTGDSDITIYDRATIASDACEAMDVPLSEVVWSMDATLGSLIFPENVDGTIA